MAKSKRPMRDDAKRDKSTPETAASSEEGGHDEEAEVEPELDRLEPDSGELPEADLSGDLPPIDGHEHDHDHEHHDDEHGGRGRGETALAPLTARSRALITTDPLTQYVNEIRRYPLLSREEEHELAVRYVNTRDVDVARRLITSNLRLVVKIAHEYRRAYRNILDLVQEGNIGLMQAVAKYDPYRGVKLSSYAAWWIRAYILKFILNNWRLVKIGTTQAQRKLFFNLRKEKELLEREGFVPEARLLAERLDVSEEEVRDMDMRLGSGDQSIDQPIGRADEGHGYSQMDVLESSAETRPDVAAEADEFRDMLHAKLDAFGKTLRGRELTIFQERLHSDSPLTLQEIGDRYNISRERARQLEKGLTVKLREYLREELGDAVEIAMGLED